MRPAGSVRSAALSCTRSAQAHEERLGSRRCASKSALHEERLEPGRPLSVGKRLRRVLRRLQADKARTAEEGGRQRGEVVAADAEPLELGSRAEVRVGHAADAVVVHLARRDGGGYCGGERASEGESEGYGGGSEGVGDGARGRGFEGEDT